MPVQLGMGEIFTLIGAFAVVTGALAKLLLSQFEQKLEARFSAMENARVQSQGMWAQRFDELRSASTEEREQMRRVENDLLKLRAELPERYVLREDWLRTQSIVELKIDKLAMRIENILIGGNKS